MANAGDLSAFVYTAHDTDFVCAQECLEMCVTPYAAYIEAAFCVLRNTNLCPVRASLKRAQRIHIGDNSNDGAARRLLLVLHGEVALDGRFRRRRHHQVDLVQLGGRALPTLSTVRIREGRSTRIPTIPPVTTSRKAALRTTSVSVEAT